MLHPFAGNRLMAKGLRASSHLRVTVEPFSPYMLHAGAAAGTGTAIGAAGLADRYDKLVARLLAATTDGGADATVFMVRCVAIALLGAGETGHRTGFDGRFDEAGSGEV